MLLKLLVARRVHTPFYVTLDSDVFLKRGTNYADLVHQGRALYQGRAESGQLANAGVGPCASSTR